MEKWVMDALVYNERNYQYRSNDTIFAMILAEQKMQKIAQTTPPTTTSAGPTIDGTDIATTFFKALRDIYGPAKAQFEMAIEKNPKLKALQAKIYEIERAIDHDYTQLAPHLLMQPGADGDMQNAMDTLHSNNADVKWNPFAGSKGTGSPIQQADIARQAAQGNAKAGLEFVNMFMAELNRTIGRNI